MFILLKSWLLIAIWDVEIFYELSDECENLSKSLHLLSVLWWNSFNKVSFKEKQLTFFKSSQKSPFNLKDLQEKQLKYSQITVDILFVIWMFN